MKKCFRKVTLIITIIMIFVLLLPACNNGTINQRNEESTTEEDSGSKTGATENNKPVKLKLLGQSNAGSAATYIKFEEREEYPVWQELKKMLDAANLELEFEIVPNEQYKVVIQTRMASASNLPDIANISHLDNTTVLNLAKQNVILELNSLIDKYSNGNIKRMYTKVYPFAPKLTTASDGNMYWFSNLHILKYQGTKDAPSTLCMLMRKDWLDKLSLPVPTNTEEYYNTLKEFRTQDVNGNGAEDEVLVYYPGDFKQSIAQWFGLGTDVTAVDVENKKIVSPWYQPGIKEYFQYLNKLVKENILDTSLFNGGTELLNQKFSENKVSSISAYAVQNWYEPMIPVEEALLMPLMPLKATEEIAPAIQLEPPTLVWNKYCITKDCKNLEAAIAFFDVVYSDKYSELLTWGVEGLTFEWVDGVRLLKDNLSNEERAKQRNVTGNQLYGDTALPRVQCSNMESSINNLIKGGEKIKADYQISTIDYKPYFYNFNDNFLALPNKEQLDEKTRIISDLKTYSSELATKLALGIASLDNWDTYIKELKELGLDRLIEINQQLHDRYNSISLD